MSSPIPFTTNNFSLAIALHLAGAGIERIRNIYTPAQLSKWGLRDAKEAVAQGKRGQIVFEIRRHEDLDEMLATYDAAAGKEDYEIPDDEPEHLQAIRIACHVLKIRKGIEKILSDPSSAWIRHGGEYDGETLRHIERQKDSVRQSGQPASITLPGFKMIKATAPESTRKRLGL